LAGKAIQNLRSQQVTGVNCILGINPTYLWFSVMLECLLTLQNNPYTMKWPSFITKTHTEISVLRRKKSLVGLTPDVFFITLETFIIIEKLIFCRSDKFVKKFRGKKQFFME
jgi:hypothetical protein